MLNLFVPLWVVPGVTDHATQIRFKAGSQLHFSVCAKVNRRKETVELISTCGVWLRVHV
jgi:hypothetical protein